MCNLDGIHLCNGHKNGRDIMEDHCLHLCAGGRASGRACGRACVRACMNSSVRVRTSVRLDDVLVETAAVRSFVDVHPVFSTH